MNPRLRTLLSSVAGACLLTLGGLAWLARDLLATASTEGSRPSLLDLLEEVRQSPVVPGLPRVAPKPPAPLNWSSPLAAARQAQACRAVDPGLRRRLWQQRETLAMQIRRIPTDPSNFGDRYRRDALGNQVNPTPRVIVLHETVYGLDSAINTFLTPHANDEDQVSYHMLIGQQGQIIQVVDPVKRAFGAGYSAFNGVWVVTNPKVGGSINNFALHLSLETPLDGENQGASHSGYSRAQYDAVAFVLADWMRRFQIPATNITTHRHVDLGGERSDPRSFDWNELEQRLVALGVGC
ncbi:MAG: peptidoglycan recognition family protein [Cyanobacteria bacterium]|nr:peptidoglycan recognition family protein [Cyanobacteriota bacterium]